MCSICTCVFCLCVRVFACVKVWGFVFDGFGGGGRVYYLWRYQCTLLYPSSFGAVLVSGRYVVQIVISAVPIDGELL